MVEKYDEKHAVMEMDYCIDMYTFIRHGLLFNLRKSRGIVDPSLDQMSSAVRHRLFSLHLINSNADHFAVSVNGGHLTTVI